jgi:phosphomannomutase
MSADGNFPHVANHKPNPEEPAANDMVRQQLLAENGDIAITNDPDADRVCVIVNHHGTAVQLNGNQTAALATEWVLSRSERRPGDYVVATIVTTDHIRAIAEHYDVDVVDNLLIGFKYVGALIREREESGRFLVGGEESYGLLAGDYVRDKDGAVGALLMAEYAGELKKTGRTLWDALVSLYERDGAYVESLESIYCLGARGFEQMKATMASLREEPPRSLAGETISAIADYRTLRRRDIASGSESNISSMSSDILVYECNNDRRCRLTIRPSGTEPKIKIYGQWFQTASGDIDGQIASMRQLLANMSAELNARVVQ